MAFAIQAWWDERQDRQVIESALRSMYDDFGKNVSIIDAVLQVHREIKDASEFVMAHTGPEPIKYVDNSKLAQSILILTYRPILRPVTGSLDSLINSGRWKLLESGELQAKLAQWPTQVGRVNFREFQGEATVTERLVPRIWQLTPIRSIDVFDPRFEHIGESRFASDYNLLLADLYFESAVDERWWDADECIRNLNELSALTKKILGLIQQELDS